MKTCNYSASKGPEPPVEALARRVLQVIIQQHERADRDQRGVGGQPPDDNGANTCYRIEVAFEPAPRCMIRFVLSGVIGLPSNLELLIIGVGPGRVSYIRDQFL